MNREISDHMRTSFEVSFTFKTVEQSLSTRFDRKDTTSPSAKPLKISELSTGRITFDDAVSIEITGKDPFAYSSVDTGEASEDQGLDPSSPAAQLEKAKSALGEVSSAIARIKEELASGPQSRARLDAAKAEVEKLAEQEAYVQSEVSKLEAQQQAFIEKKDETKKTVEVIQPDIQMEIIIPEDTTLSIIQMIEKNPVEAENSHSGLDARRVQSLLITPYSLGTPMAY